MARGNRFFKLRRAVFLVRRSVPRVARPLSKVVAARPPERPVILIGCPRSGTSALLQAFLRSPELATVQLEGHILWDEFHPKNRRDSDALGSADVSDRERRYIQLAVQLFARRPRFIDKTPENTLRIGYLDALFPDATFVFLRRRAADNVNSLIEGWRARPRFVTHRLSTPLEGIAPLDGRLWSFALLPEWRSLTRSSLEEICARQYVVCNESVLAAQSAMDPSRWRDLTYEAFVAAPVDELRQLFASLDLPWSAAVEQYAGELDRRPSATAVTPPRRDKWREQNPDAIERILPLVRDTERRLGYDSSAST